MTIIKNSGQYLLAYAFLHPWGVLFAASCSYATNHSLVQSLIHGIFSWFYVIYWMIKYS